MKKRVLVTGGSRGIGRAIALSLAEDGFSVTAAAGSDSEALRNTAEALKAKDAFSSALVFDVSDTEGAKAALEADIAEHGPFWGVVVCAGIARDAAFPAMPAEDWKRVIDVDLNGFYSTVQPCVMPMISLRDGGRIVAVSSVSGITGNRGQTNYSAAKAGLIGAAKALAVELAKRKITVNCVAPGLIDTEMTSDGAMNETAREAALSMIPMKRAGTAEEVASAVRFFFSPGASYITRQVLSVNGGMI